MINLITNTDFKGLTSLAGMGSDFNVTSLNTYIAINQEKILKQALGESLYNLLDTGYVPATNDKWKKLIEGDTYVLQRDSKDFTIKYKGVKEMLVGLIYFDYKSDLATQSTITGETVSSNANSIISKVDRHAIKAYNNGIDLYGQLQETNDIEFVVVGDFPFFIGSKSLDIYKGNLYNYITYQNGQDSTAYPNWIFTALTKINEFGI